MRTPSNDRNVVSPGHLLQPGNTLIGESGLHSIVLLVNDVP